MIRYTIIFLALFLAGGHLIAQENTGKILRQQRVALQRELADLAEKINHTDRGLYSSAKQRILLQNQIAARKREIEVLDGKLGMIENQLHHTDAGLNDLYFRLKKLKQSYGATLALSWKLMNRPQVIQVMYTADDANTEQQRVQFIKILRRLQLRQANNIRQLQVQYDNRKQQLGNEQVNTNNRLLKEMVVSGELSGKEKILSAQETRLQKTKDALQLMVKRKKEQQRSIENRIKALVPEPQSPPVKNISAAGKGNAGKKEPLKTGLLKRNDAIFLSKGNLPCPVDGKILMHFGISENTPVKIDNLFLTLQTAASGTPVNVVFPGEVSGVSKVEDTYLVIVRHGKIYTIYGNLASAAVQKGQQIGTGTLIGTVASGYESSNGELEFGVYMNNKLVDPELWIRCR